MTRLSDEALFAAYVTRFPNAYMGPPLELGIHCFPWAEFRKHAPEAIRTGRPIDWSEHFAPLPPGAES